MESAASLFPVSSSSEDETRRAGRSFATHLRAGDVVALMGDMGAGKTQFVKGVAEAFGIDPETVTSPTFTIAHEYSGSELIFHLDLYRLRTPADIQSAAVEEYFLMDGICLVEWPERAEYLLPARSVIIRITHRGEDKRLIECFQPDTA